MWAGHLAGVHAPGLQIFNLVCPPAWMILNSNPHYSVFQDRQHHLESEVDFKSTPDLQKQPVCPT